MVSYRFKRDGQYIQRELELDPLDEHQDQVYPESLEEQVDYSAFYDTYYDGFGEDSISREQEKKQGLIARGKERLSSVKEDVTDYIICKWNVTKTITQMKIHFGCVSNNKNEIENSLNKVSFLP